MASKKNYNNTDRDDGIRGELLTRQDNEAALKKLDGMSKKVLNGDGNPPAKSQWSTGRGCPKCKNQLYTKELTKKGTLVVFCGTCGSEYHHGDLEDPNNDWLHRDIPDSLVLQMMAVNDARLRAQGK